MKPGLKLNRWVKGILVILFILILGLIIFVIWFWNSYKNEIQLLRAIQSQSEVNYLVIFQNTLELRPTGGFIGNFAEVTLDKGKVKQYKIYNTNVFDYGKPGIPAPKPFRDMLAVDEMQLRDSNWNPDFPATAKQVVELYKLEGGTKDIAGVVAINASVLPELLKILGPVYVDEINKPLDENNILLELQYELNFGFIEKGIDRVDRKEPIKDVALEIETRIRKSGFRDLYKIANLILDQANKKQILLWSQNKDIQDKIVNLNWDGDIESNLEGDYFMLVDANLGALKTDYYMKREISKSISQCENKICSQVSITYTNTATKASPLNNDYKSYTRIILPKEAFVNSIDGIKGNMNTVDYTYDYDKKIVGFEILIPFNNSKTIVLDYTIPSIDKYKLYIQKQSGINGFDFKLDNKINNSTRSIFVDIDMSLID